MLTFLRSRTRGQLLTIAMVAVAAATATCVTVLVSSHRAVPTQRRSGLQAMVPTVAASLPTPAPAPTRAGGTSPAPSVSPSPSLLPATTSADVYAESVAKALWNIGYANTDRDTVLAFWRAQLSPVLPAGTPSGTTLLEAHDAAMSTLTTLLPTGPVWSTLAADHTVSTFTVTGVIEPPTWVEAVASGKIIDPGLTAREVIGVQKISYGSGAAARTTAQTQQLLVAVLCPPTTASCRVVVFPPVGSSSATG